MRGLAHVSMERCLFPEKSEIQTSQLHVFGDASEEAYAAVAYIRNIYRSGRVLNRIVKASSKLTPKKTLSVPKSELNPALLGSRLASAIQSSLTHPIQQRFFGRIAAHFGTGSELRLPFIRYLYPTGSVRFRP